MTQLCQVNNRLIRFLPIPGLLTLFFLTIIALFYPSDILGVICTGIGTQGTCNNSDCTNSCTNSQWCVFSNCTCRDLNSDGVGECVAGCNPPQDTSSICASSTNPTGKCNSWICPDCQNGWCGGCRTGYFCNSDNTCEELPLCPCDQDSAFCVGVKYTSGPTTICRAQECTGTKPADCGNTALVCSGQTYNSLNGCGSCTGTKVCTSSTPTPSSTPSSTPTPSSSPSTCTTPCGGCGQPCCPTNPSNACYASGNYCTTGGVCDATSKCSGGSCAAAASCVADGGTCRDASGTITACCTGGIGGCCTGPTCGSLLNKCGSPSGGTCDVTTDYCRYENGVLVNNCCPGYVCNLTNAAEGTDACQLPSCAEPGASCGGSVSCCTGSCGAIDRQTTTCTTSCDYCRGKPDSCGYIGGQYCCWEDGTDCTSCTTTTTTTYQCDVCTQTAPAAPVLTSPRHNEIISSDPSLSTTLTWTHSDWGTQCTDTTADKYKIYFNQTTCGTAVTPTTQVGEATSNVHQWYMANLQDNTCYCWKVKADSGAGSTDSATYCFKMLLNAYPWWQTQDADLWSQGNVRSSIPVQCVESSSCQEEFSLPGPGGYPGVIAHNGMASFGSGIVSNKGWIVRSGYAAARGVSYSSFAALAPSGTFTDSSSMISGDSINGGQLVSGFNSGGYTWRYRDGNLTISSQANLNNTKVILFVSGDLRINGRIRLNKGSGFFMAIVRGNIIIDPSVDSENPNQPSLEGLFYADGTISTGSTGTSSGDSKLYVRGALIGKSGLNLQRNLDPMRTTGANNLTPAEFIEYAPDLILTFPRELSRSGIVWREIEP